MVVDLPARLNGPVSRLVRTKGPVAIGMFPDGSILIVGPQDMPVIVKGGKVYDAPADWTPGAKRDIEFRARGS